VAAVVGENNFGAKNSRKKKVWEKIECCHKMDKMKKTNPTRGPGGT